MSSVDDLLKDWRSAYAQWVLSELELRQARHRSPVSPAIAQLEAQVRARQLECKAIQDAINSPLERLPQGPREQHTAVQRNAA